MILGILIAVMGLTAVNQANDLIGAAFLYSANPASVPTISFLVNRLPPSVVTTLQHLPNVETIPAQYPVAYLLACTSADQTGTIQITGYQEVYRQSIGDVSTDEWSSSRPWRNCDGCQ